MTEPSKTHHNNSTFAQQVVASALHEFGKQVIIDCSLLMFHQLAAKVYYLQDNGVKIPVDENGQYVVCDPEEEHDLRADLLNVVIKFNTLHRNGLGARLTPLLENVAGAKNLIADPFLLAVINNAGKYKINARDTAIESLLEKIMDFELGDYTEAIYDSYDDHRSEIEVSVFEDETLQCMCDYCESFFEVQDIENQLGQTELNSFQRVLFHTFRDSME